MLEPLSVIGKASERGGQKGFNVPERLLYLTKSQAKMQDQMDILRLELKAQQAELDLFLAEEAAITSRSAEKKQALRQRRKADAETRSPEPEAFPYKEN